MATKGNRLKRYGVAFGAMLGLVAGAAQAADLGLDPYRFFLNYQVKGIGSPAYQVLPTATGDSPFNTKDTPMLIPCGVEFFGGQLRIVSGGPDDVYARVTFELHKADGATITSTGYSGTTFFDHLDMNVSGLLSAGQGEDAGFTPVSKVNVFKDWLYQPKDLPKNAPVRMQMTVSGFEDPQFTQGVNDPNPANDVMNVWVERVCD